MRNEQAAKHLRRDLDEWLKNWGKLRRDVPRRGWIHNIREALGMSTAQLGKRMKISQSAIVVLEQSEAKGTMQLATLRRAAKALNCDLVYALVPQDGTLEKTLEVRRMRMADLGLYVLLRDSKLNAAEKRGLIKAYGDRIKRKKIWE